MSRHESLPEPNAPSIEWIQLQAHEVQKVSIYVLLHTCSWSKVRVYIVVYLCVE